MRTEPERALLRLLQLSSPSLPVGAFSYSEGLESLVQQGRMADAQGLEDWIQDALRWGSVRLEGGVMLRAHRAVQAGDRVALRDWNRWLSATRETEELRLQNLQMGQSLAHLLCALEAGLADWLDEEEAWNYVAAFGAGAAWWGIPPKEGLLGYMHGWASNLVGAGVRLVPLGQTIAQALLLSLHAPIAEAAREIAELPDAELFACTWGQSLASMQHETLYSRLFRS